MKTALVTGASRRLGLFLCAQLLEQGWQVIAITRTPSEALARLEAHGIQIFTLDYTDPAQIAEVMATLKKCIATLDLMVHNASFFEKDALHEEDRVAYFDALYALHMRLPAQLNEGLRDLLYDEECPGCIVHITDIFVENPDEEFGLYCATKAGSENLAKTYAKRFAPGVRVNTLQPGPLAFLPAHSSEKKGLVGNQTLLPVSPGFMPILQAIQFLVENRFVTGTSIKVDGGRSIGQW